MQASPHKPQSRDRPAPGRAGHAATVALHAADAFAADATAAADTDGPPNAGGQATSRTGSAQGAGTAVCSAERET